MGKSVESLSARVLVLQVLAHALIFSAQNVGNLAERVLLASDTTASMALGLSGTAFGLLSAFATNFVNAGQHTTGRRTGDGDFRGAQAAARQALVLAGGGGVLGLVIAATAGATALFATGPARHAALFLAAQGLALGPQLSAAALTGYFAATLRVGPGLLAAVTALPIAIHVALAWLLTGVLAWSLTGAGVARLGAALAVAAGVFAIAQTEFRDIVGSVRRFDRALLRSMVAEGSVFGLQQVVAGVMVLLLYFRAASVGAIEATALTLTHSGVYPLLFAFAWGSSQAVGAAAALAVGRGNARELARITWLGLGLAAGLAFALPWGIYALIGRAVLPRLIESSAVLAVAVRFMEALAIFFVVDFAINYLSALLRAAKEQVYLLKVTAAVAVGFAFLILALPLPPDITYLMGAFITAQAVWALLLLVRVITRWPGLAGRRITAPGQAQHRSARRKDPVVEHQMMNAFDPKTGQLPPTLRALAMGLVAETAVPLLHKPRPENPLSADHGELGAGARDFEWQDLRRKCDELLGLVLQADNPEEAAAYVFGYLPKHFDSVFDLLGGRKRECVT
jgi:Na+-driven multidrug efflux pump